MSPTLEKTKLVANEQKLIEANESAASEKA